MRQASAGLRWRFGAPRGGFSAATLYGSGHPMGPREHKLVTVYDFSSGLPVLDTERLRLRQLIAADAQPLFEIFADPEVMKYWSSAPLVGIDDAHALLADIDEGRKEQRFFQWGITRRDDDRVIGTTTLYAWDRNHRRAELGFALHRNAWNQGIGTEAARRIVQFAFEEMDLHRIEADPDPQNAASIRILKRLGFREEGYLRERYLPDGVPQDAVFMGLLRSEWMNRVGQRNLP